MELLGRLQRRGTRLVDKLALFEGHDGMTYLGEVGEEVG